MSIWRPRQRDCNDGQIRLTAKAADGSSKKRSMNNIAVEKEKDYDSQKYA